MAHRNVELFELLALVQDLHGSRESLDDAIADLANWMDVARDRLTDQDWIVLGEIGAVLYREVRRRGM
ncbi:hypothetical protein WKW77_29465 [Variovorax ureilyticus]|uniref:Uncharacterized protein n=1 Tax=Variovorax ureilyticus TaxID=1836198 RepID=A0ABU8VNJ2_9BURK